MNSDKIIELLMYAVPSLITGGVAYYLFDNYFKDQQNTRRWLLQKENQKHSLPLRLQAYERLALFLERINPTKLLIRVAPLNDDKVNYQNLLIKHIEQEYEHNITQQVYVTNELWTMLLTAKNTIIQNIRKTDGYQEIMPFIVSKAALSASAVFALDNFVFNATACVSSALFT